MRKPRDRLEIWWPKLYWLARTYKIGVLHVPETHWKRVCGPLYNTDGVEFMEREGHGFDVKRRRVFLVHEDRAEAVGWYQPRSVERDLHEMSHVICQAPWLDPNDVGEDWMLMQVERCIARALFWPHDKRSYALVVNWQEITTSQFYDTELGMVGAHYTHTTMWKEGLARGRSIGLLDQRNRPTWRMPQWDRMPRELRSIEDHQPPDRW